MSAGAVERRAVVARNFPAAWVAPASLGSLPQKISSLLQRIGPLEGLPVIAQGSTGLEALARFKTAEAAHDAVQTLHGTDLRTAAEQKAANFQAPKDGERFWLRTAVDAGVAVPALPAAAAPPAAAAGLAPAAPLAAATAAAVKRTKPNGVYLSPLPPSWAEQDVNLLASPYGTVHRVKIETLPNGQKGAFIDYQKDAAASTAKAGLDGLSLMGARMRCVMQEEPEPPKPVRSIVLHLDDLPMPSRPEAEPRLDDRELFLTDIPRTSRTEDAATMWVSGFGEVEEVCLLKDAALKPTGKAYARFRSHTEALKALKALRATAADGAQQASWSESERALRGARGAYGLSVLRRLAGEGGARLQEIRQATGLLGLSLRNTEDPATADPKASPSTAGQRVHFVVQAERASQADECKALLSAELAKVHEAYTREVRGSLVLRGFPASWSEKGLKFVFAPFGGLSSVALEEEEPPPNATDEAKAASSVRLAYVKLRNESAIEKAVANLHQTKVGDGDLVEESVVACHQWHQRGWSDGSFQVPIFIDQLAMSRRPLEAGPGPEDRELFVQNLPLQDMNRQQLQEYFEGFGEVEDLHLISGVFSSEPTGEGYVRFKHHRDAQRCIEALTPNSPHEAEPTDLAGSWSESERALQRKANSYRFNLLAELVGADGSGIERLKSEAKLKGLWVLAETLQQKDRGAPPASGRQLEFVGRVQDEAHVRTFRELLERALEETHTKITDRIEKRRRKAELAATDAARPAEKADAAAPATAAGNGDPAGGGAPPGEAAWHGSGGPGAWQTPPYWGNWQPPSGAGPGAYPHFPPHGQMPPGYGGPPGQPGPPGPWTRPPVAAAPSGKAATVFEQMQASPRDQEDGSQARDHRRRSRSRRRRHRSGEDADKDKKHSGSHHERRRRRDRSGNADDAEDAAQGDR